MASEIDLGGTIYISSKNAAEKTGYTQDYIGQLARGGQIEAKRVAGMWYILEQSLRDYKAKADQFVPTPPQGFTPSPDKEVSVSFDGKDYISTARAAKITGYNQDYVGQLARSGEVLSRQVGNRWYIDRESLLAHKKSKDDLLAAVQVESVGLAKPGSERANNEPKNDLLEQPLPEKSENTSPIAEKEEEVTHFEYVKEEAPLIPEPAPEIPSVEADEPEPMPEFPRRKVATPAFEEYREAAYSAPEPIAIRKLEESEPYRPPVSRIPAEPAPEPEIYVDPLDRATAPEAESQQYVENAVIEEHIYIDEDELPQSKKGRKQGRGTVFALGGIAVAAALGTVAYIGTSLGLINLSGIIPWPQSSQNAAAANPVVNNDSSLIPERVRSLFSKEIIYERQ